MQSNFGEEVEFLFIYTREAHAADSARPAMKEVEQPVSTEERRGVAIEFLDEMELKIPALLDNIDDKTATDYASLPDRLYLVGKDGKIAYAGEKGPRGFKIDELEQAITDEVGGKAKKQTPSTASSGGPSQVDDRRIRMMSMMMPTFGAINTNGDGQLSAEEIKAASETLLTLDKNGDGELSAEELRPTRPTRGGGGGGGRGRGRGR
jgi:hypothetical protein